MKVDFLADRVPEFGSQIRVPDPEPDPRARPGARFGSQPRSPESASREPFRQALKGRRSKPAASSPSNAIRGGRSTAPETNDTPANKNCPRNC
jgi:hypothetical protein